MSTNDNQNPKDPFEQNGHPSDQESPYGLNDELLDSEEMDAEEEAFRRLVLQAQQEALQKDQSQPKQTSLLKRWMIMIMACVLLISSFSILFQVLSIPALEFMKASATLSQQDQVKALKDTVVVVETENAKGTGFSIDDSGHIITNAHVISGQKMIRVLFQNHGTYTAQVVESYPEIDIAVLKVDGENLPFVQLAQKSPDNDASVIFIGNPLSFHHIANQGTLRSSILLTDWQKEVRMIDAPIYRGNSGSPVFDEHFQVIGIIFATLHTDDEGKVGLMVPIEHFHELSGRL